MTDTPGGAPAPPKRSILRTVILVVATVAVVGMALVGYARYAMARDTNLAVGSVAPDFTLPDQNGTPITLSEVLADHRGAIVAFYPQDFTPG